MHHVSTDCSYDNLGARTRRAPPRAYQRWPRHAREVSTRTPRSFVHTRRDVTRTCSAAPAHRSSSGCGTRRHPTATRGRWRGPARGRGRPWRHTTRVRRSLRDSSCRVLWGRGHEHVLRKHIPVLASESKSRRAPRNAEAPSPPPRTAVLVVPLGASHRAVVAGRAHLRWWKSRGAKVARGTGRCA